MLANISLSHPVIAEGAESQIDVLVNFSSGEATVARRPLNLSLVLDRSGSMGGSPLRHAIGASKKLVDRLTPEDTLSVVIYDDSIDTILPPSKVEDQKAIKALIDKVRAGGITNLHGGWAKGCQHVKDKASKGTINRVLLLTDGQANVGETNTSKLIDYAAAESKNQVVTTTLGFGNYFNEDLLIGMADASGGNFYFIQATADAAEVFDIEVEGLATLLTRNLRVTFEPGPGVELVEVLNNYGVASGPGGSEIQVGEVYGSEPRPLHMILKVNAGAGAEASLGTLRWTYDIKVGDGIEEQTGTAAFSIALGDADAARHTKLDTGVLVEAARLRAGKIKEEATKLGDAGKYEEAAARLKAVIDQMKARGLDDTFEIAEEISQLEYFASLFENRQYGTAQRKEIKDQSYQARSRGRGDLKLRGLSTGSTTGLKDVTFAEGEETGGVVVECIKAGGKLRVRAISEGYDPDFNIQFPRAIRREGARYLVEELALAGSGSFYRANGDIKILLRPGESRPDVGGGGGRRGNLSKANALKLSDLETTDEVGDGVLIQCVKDKSKLRARVVSDGYDPDKNMRFPRGIRQEGILFVVDEVRPSSDGSYYIAYGKIKHLVQT